MALATCIQNTSFCSRIVNRADIPNVMYSLSSGVFSENEASIAIASKPVFNQRTKHIQIKYQYVNENVEHGNVALEWMQSRDNYADMMTKPVGKKYIFTDHYPYNMGGHQIPRVPNLIKTVKDDIIPCPHCSLAQLGKDHQLEEKYQLLF